MNRASHRCIQIMLFILIMVSIGCQKSTVPINLNNFDPSQDQRFIIKQYLNQAVHMVQKAQDLRRKSERYAQLFGPESEWVTSAKMLEAFYINEAYDREKLAAQHVGLASFRPRAVSFKTREGKE
ncbi:MAG: hypothetical protein NPIRA02_27280 [Nitrospirales bacterium]|nr:MAG: hypothetical protein NPIRA02_27280 [Nitrospirales bacterium]